MSMLMVMKRVLPWVLPFLAACYESEPAERDADNGKRDAATSEQDANAATSERDANAAKTEHDADAKTEHDATAAREDLCDGTDDVRLAVMNIGGHVDTSYAFTNPYGWHFLFVTGRCTFLAKPDASSDGSFIEGTFSSEQGDSLSRAFALDALRGKTYRTQGGCPDAPITQVISTRGYAEGACGDEPPALIAEVLRGVMPALELARSNGQPANGAVEVVAIGDYQGGKTPTVGATAWPFTWPIAEASVQWSTTSGAPDFLDKVRTLMGDEADHARQLRSDAVAKPTYRGRIDVVANETTYALFVRDQVDAAWQSAIARFLAANDPFHPKPVALCKAERVLDGVRFDAPSLYGKRFSVSTQADIPCGAELCWDGRFALEVPAGAALRIQRPEQTRTCLGQLAYTNLTADLQPMIDAYRMGHPGSSVVIDISLEGAEPASTRLENIEDDVGP